MGVLQQSFLQERGTDNQKKPCEGPRTLGFTLDFAADSDWLIDYAPQQPGRFEVLQGIYIDNSTNGQPVTLLVRSTGQRLTIRKNAQGYFSVLSANPIQLEFTSTGGVPVNIFLLNFPVASAVWDV